jgi:hypothetical protein
VEKPSVDPSVLQVDDGHWDICSAAEMAALNSADCSPSLKSPENALRSHDLQGSKIGSHPTSSKRPHTIPGSRRSNMRVPQESVREAADKADRYRFRAITYMMS